jgi:hypothetical protein
MSTSYFLSHTIDKEILRKKNWSFSAKEGDEVHLLGETEIDGKEYYLHFYLDDDTKEIMAFDRYNTNFPAAAKLIHELYDLGYEYNNMDAEKVVYDDDVLQELFHEALRRRRKDESNGDT